MKKIKVQALSKEAFSEFGDYYNLVEPTGHTLGNFYHDHVLYPVSGEVPVGFSTLVAARDEFVVKKAEYHDRTGEVILPLDGDVVVHVAPPSSVPVPELTQAFLVPKGTIIRLNVAVWHLCPLPLEQEKVHLMVALPERTYFSDCHVVDYEPEQYVEIDL